jgi:hypothetical protein
VNQCCSRGHSKSFCDTIPQWTDFIRRSRQVPSVREPGPRLIISLTKLGHAVMLALSRSPAIWGMSDQTMTIGITGPRRRAPWRGPVVALIIAIIVVVICLILLGLTGDLLVDWLWVSAIGYLGLLDDHRRRSRSLLRRLHGDRHHLVGERIARVPLRPVGVDAASRRLRLETHGNCDVVRRVRIHASLVAVAPGHRHRRRPPRHACRLGRGP